MESPLSLHAPHTRPTSLASPTWYSFLLSFFLSSFVNLILYSYCSGKRLRFSRESWLLQGLRRSVLTPHSLHCILSSSPAAPNVCFLFFSSLSHSCFYLSCASSPFALRRKQRSSRPLWHQPRAKSQLLLSFFIATQCVLIRRQRV